MSMMVRGSPICLCAVLSGLLMWVPGRYDGSLVAALAELLDDHLGKPCFSFLMFETVKGWLVLIAFPRWSKFTMHYARI
jgi:hypothetical protein